MKATSIVLFVAVLVCCFLPSNAAAAGNGAFARERDGHKARRISLMPGEQPDSCPTGCISNADCQYSSESCAICNRPHDSDPAGPCIDSNEFCGTPCEANYDCAPRDGCSICNMSHETVGWGRCIAPPSTCGKSCTDNYECDSGCDKCVNSVCVQGHGYCGATCQSSNDCDLASTCVTCGPSGTCIEPKCGSACSSHQDCIFYDQPCTYCHDGKCRKPSNTPLGCGDRCGEGNGVCSGNCSLCGMIDIGQSICVNPNQPPGCGTYCGYGSRGCNTQQGECTYCSGTCTTYAKAKATGRVLPEHRHLMHLDEAPPGSHLPVDFRRRQKTEDNKKP